MPSKIPPPGTPEHDAWKRKEAERVAAYRAGKKDKEPSMAGKRTTLAIQQIRIDGGTQQRVDWKPEIVQEYAEAIKHDITLPDMIVFFDKKHYWLADGFYRRAAYAEADVTEVPVEVREGTQRDAILYSVGANSTHGLRRTNADKRRAVTTLLTDEEWSKRSDGWIAEQCSVSRIFVAELRRSLVNFTSETQREGRDGRVTNVGNIGKKAEPDGEYFTDGEEPDDKALTGDGDDDRDDQSTLKERAANKEIVHDTLTAAQQAKREQEQAEREMTDDEWVETIPVYRVLKKLGGKGILARRDILSARTMVDAKAQGNYEYYARRTETFKVGGNTPYARVLVPAANLKHPRDWKICVCRGVGCSKCDHAGYDLSGAGIDAARVESGEVQL